MSRFGQQEGPPYKWPLLFDGDIGFVEVDTPELLEEAKRFFALQWDWVHGYIWAEALEELPVWWEGYELVRTPEGLSELARVGAFAEIEEIYRELYG
jgi:hypothetical protein